MAKELLKSSHYATAKLETFTTTNVSVRLI